MSNEVAIRLVLDRACRECGLGNWFMFAKQLPASYELMIERAAELGFESGERNGFEAGQKQKEAEIVKEIDNRISRNESVLHNTLFSSSTIGLREAIAELKDLKKRLFSEGAKRKMSWAELYCPNIQILFEMKEKDTRQFVIDYCDRNPCHSCPLHSNKVMIKSIGTVKSRVGSGSQIKRYENEKRLQGGEKKV